MPVLSYGNYSHADFPSVTIQRSRRSNPDGTKPWDHISWTIRGLLSNSSQSSLLTAVAALRTAYATNGLDLALKQTAGGTALETLTNASTLGGIRITRPPDLPEGRGPELATLHHYEIVLEADVPASGSLSAYDEETSTSYETNERNLTTKRSSGRARTPVGTSALALFAGKNPGAPGSAYHLGGTSRQVNDQDTQLDWSYVWQEGPKAWPSGVYNPTVTSTLELDEQRRQVYTVAATMYGPNAAAECRKLAQGLRLLSSSWVENPYEQSVSVVYRYLGSTGPSLMSFVCSLTWEAGGQEFVMRATCDGRPPIKQKTIVTPWRCIEQGNAVGSSAFPAIPAPAYGAANLHPGGTIRRSGPKRLAGGGFSEYEVSWSRTYEFAASPGYRNPSTS